MFREYRFTILGRPVSQKNSKEIYRRKGGAPFVASNKGVRAWREHARVQLMTQRHGDKITGDIEAEVKAYMAKGQRIDADNLQCAPLDALQDAGIIDNDYQISKSTGERFRDPENPRVEITLRERSF